MSAPEHYLTATAMDGGFVVMGCRCGSIFKGQYAIVLQLWVDHLGKVSHAEGQDQ